MRFHCSRLCAGVGEKTAWVCGRSKGKCYTHSVYYSLFLPCSLTVSTYSILASTHGNPFFPWMLQYGAWFYIFGRLCVLPGWYRFNWFLQRWILKLMRHKTDSLHKKPNVITNLTKINELCMSLIFYPIETMKQDHYMTHLLSFPNIVLCYAAVAKSTLLWQ